MINKKINDDEIVNGYTIETIYVQLDVKAGQ